MKNNKFSHQSCIIQLNHLIENCTYVKYAISTYKNEIPCQTVCNKMALDPIPDELKDFK